MDKLTENKRETTERGGLTPPAKGKTKTFLIGKELETNDLRQTAAERGKRDDNKTQPKTPDSLRREASQAAGAAPTLRYGPAGDSAPRLRLKASGMTERFPFGASTRPAPPSFPHKQPSLRIGPEPSRARSGEADP